MDGSRERYARLRQLLFEATDLEGEARAVFLDRACAGDADLRRDLDRLLETDPIRTEQLVSPAPAAAETAVSPPQIPGYRIVREIGRGGMGTVYEARASEGDARVALKVLNPGLLATPDLVQRFKLEAELGAQVDHPNVVRALGAGQHEGIHYLVMEHVEGRSLRALLEELGSVPEALIREIAREASEGLAAIHDAGIVHRDIKPENLLITGDDRVRIMDLGIAKAGGSSLQLTLEGHFLGSLQYAPPEQCEGQPVSAATDLYALGVVLYELATGRNPFRRESPGAVLRAQIETDPERACEVDPAVSPFLSEVMETLLRKDPQARFASAHALGRALNEGEQGAWWSERETLRRAAARPHVPVPRMTRLHGRDDQLDRLLAIWSRTRKQGKGGTVVIEADAGLGKTRLLDALVRRVDAEQSHLLYGAFVPHGGLRGLSGSLATHFGGSHLAESLGRYLEADEEVVESFVATLSSLHGTPKGGRETFVALACRLLRGLSVEKPTLWMLDDLHLAPDLGHEVAASLARVAADHRALLVLTTAPDCAPAGRLVAAGDAERIVLGRLSPRSVVDLLREAFESEALADRIGAKVAHKSDGVPFFVFEMIQALREGGFVERRRDGSYVQTKAVDEIRVPSAIRDLVAERIADLERSERAVLDLAAVQGFEFEAELIAAVLKRPLVSVLQDLAEMERRQGIVQAVGRRFRFDHQQICDVVYEDLPDRLREEYHALIADAHAKSAGFDPVFVADHHLRGSRPEGAADHLGAVAELLRVRDPEERLVEIASAALRQPGLLEGQARIDLVVVLALHLGSLSRTVEARELLTEVLSQAEDPGQKARAFRALADQFSVAGQSEEAQRMLAEASRQAALSDIPNLAADIDSSRAQAAWLRGDLTEAREAAEAYLAVTRELDRPRFIAFALNRLGGIATEQGEHEDAERYLDEAEAIAKQHQAERQLMFGGNYRSVLLWRQGRFAEARELFEEHLERARRLAHRRAELYAHVNLGELALRMGRPPQARRHLSIAVEIGRELGVADLRARTLLGLARHDIETGDMAAARGRIEEAKVVSSRIRESSVVAEVAYFHGIEAQAREASYEAAMQYREAVRRAQAPGAQDVLGLAVARLATLPGGDVREAEAVLDREGRRMSHSSRLESHFHLFKAGGDRAHLERAHRLLSEERDQSPAEFRESMITNVALHSAIMAELES